LINKRNEIRKTGGGDRYGGGNSLTNISNAAPYTRKTKKQTSPDYIYSHSAQDLSVERNKFSFF
jgi:hypothetical protein